MILVTVGMHTEGLPRLVKEMDLIASRIDEEVVMQIGSTRYLPNATRWFAFATYEEMDSLCEQARVIVSHAGAGSILTALHHNKPLIVMPRLRRYGEAIDDHQLELAQALAEAGMLLVVHETAELSDKLNAAQTFTPQVPSHSHLIEALRRLVTVPAERAR